ncbi:MAG: metal ABC transporter permease, partial [SAR324 cluster bacterium]|nr:metal ABC transporter permease [SAR324 cluster bacterium]
LRPDADGKALVQALLIVSHRVTSMERADHILVLDEGRIVDQGTHAELVRRPGDYQQMWRLQNGSPAPETPQASQLAPVV